ncbi:hypothetical protein FHETE_4765 [Fusarium heterosporum]|uniref:CENP-V/GFA domain-containing protein n=1 Tax=Fusarium heterosporum TaxID=42747 RepID=A0A8H5WP18_FUSHE|nr:hypothetical protein FHETE_4765 [Fusarium heterosporum]
MTTDGEKVTLTAQCLCKAHTFSAEIAQPKLPLDGSICHCTSCRNLTGAMYSSDAHWPGPSDVIVNSDLKRYTFTSNCSILFCGTCGSAMFWNEHYPDEPQNFLVFTGILDNMELKGLVKFAQQIFVGDTIDGGVSPLLRDINHDGTKLRCWKGRAGKSEELSDGWPGGEETIAIGNAEKGDIPLHCHCKGVDLVFRPSNVDFSTMNTDSVPSYIDPKTHKHLATLDPCNSCRLSCGVDIMSWTFALLKQIDFPQNSGESSFPQSTNELKEAVENSAKDKRYGSLAMYRSSPDVQRYFCSQCSAVVFYAVDDRPDLVDVAVGLLHAPDGARAESVLSWNLGAKMMGVEDYVGGWREEFANAVKETSENWRIKNDYPKAWSRIKSEKAQKKAEDERLRLQLGALSC